MLFSNEDDLEAIKSQIHKAARRYERRTSKRPLLDPEDLEQLVFERLVEKFGQEFMTDYLEDSRKLIWKIVESVLSDERRRAKSQFKRLRAWKELEEARRTSPDALHKALVARFKEALVTVPPDIQYALYQYYYRKRSLKSIAAEVKMTPATLVNLIRNARELLREIVNTEFSADPRTRRIVGIRKKRS